MFVVGEWENSNGEGLGYPYSEGMESWRVDIVCVRRMVEVLRDSSDGGDGTLNASVSVGRIFVHTMLEEERSLYLQSRDGQRERYDPSRDARGRLGSSP